MVVTYLYICYPILEILCDSNNLFCKYLENRPSDEYMDEKSFSKSHLLQHIQKSSKLLFQIIVKTDKN